MQLDMSKIILCIFCAVSFSQAPFKIFNNKKDVDKKELKQAIVGHFHFPYDYTCPQKKIRAFLPKPKKKLFFGFSSTLGRGPLKQSKKVSMPS